MSNNSYISIPKVGPQQSAESHVYEVLKAQIIRGDLKAGTQLAQGEIAERLGVSRIPVRDAIRHLAASGLVVVGANRRACVMTLRDEDLHELFQMRAALEGLAARNAALNLQPADLTKLAKLAERMDESEHYIEQWLPLHDEFHRLVYARSNMPRLITEIERLHQQLEPFVRVLANVQSVAELKLSRHRDLVSTLCTLDPVRMEQTVRAHVLQASAEIRETIRTTHMEASASKPATTDPVGQQRPAAPTLEAQT